MQEAVTRTGHRSPVYGKSLCKACAPLSCQNYERRDSRPLKKQSSLIRALEGFAILSTTRKSQRFYISLKWGRLSSIINLRVHHTLLNVLSSEPVLQRYLRVIVQIPLPGELFSWCMRIALTFHSLVYIYSFPVSVLNFPEKTFQSSGGSDI